MKKLMMPLVAMLVASVFLVGCKGDKGDPGPVGATGQTGQTGATGQNGQDAKNGKYYDISATYGTATTEYTYSMPANAFYNKAVFVYLDNGYKDWLMLPHLTINSGYVKVYHTAEIDEVLSKIRFKTKNFDTDGTTSPWGSNVTINYRVVTIDISAARTDVNFSNYNEVKEAFNLKD